MITFDYEKEELYTLNITYLPRQSTVNAFALVQPYIQEPLNASQCWFVHLESQVFPQEAEEYRVTSQPEKKRYIGHITHLGNILQQTSSLNTAMKVETQWLSRFYLPCTKT